jgi:hypothetical protein
MARGIPP